MIKDGVYNGSIYVSVAGLGSSGYICMKITADGTLSVTESQATASTWTPCIACIAAK